MSAKRQLEGKAKCEGRAEDGNVNDSVTTGDILLTSCVSKAVAR